MRLWNVAAAEKQRRVCRQWLNPRACTGTRSRKNILERRCEETRRRNRAMSTWEQRKVCWGGGCTAPPGRRKQPSLQRKPVCCEEPCADWFVQSAGNPSDSHGFFRSWFVYPSSFCVEREPSMCRVMMRNDLKVLVVAALIIFTSTCIADIAAGAEKHWEIGTPITTYWAIPAITDATAKQIADGGFNFTNLCPEQSLDIASKYGMRALLYAEILRGEDLFGNPMTDPAEIAQIDALVERVKDHPAMYLYYVCDEPRASSFPALGKLLAHLRERDPAHAAFINLLPMNAFFTTAEYREYLRLFIEQVKPPFLCYDDYSFFSESGQKNLSSNDLIDGDRYLLNLALIREAALGAGIPFMAIVQSCSYHKDWRAPNGDEMRWLNYTLLAHGAEGISYFVYYVDHYYKDAIKRGVDPGGMMRPDGSTTTQYAAAKELNPQFVAVASELQPFRSLGVYRDSKRAPLPEGAVALPKNAPFYIDRSKEGVTGQSKITAEGMLLGYFGKTRPTHVLVVNLNYKSAVTRTVVGPDRLYLFDAVTRKWTPSATGSRVTVTLPRGGGKLIRVRQ